MQVLFIHGFGGAAEHWDALRSELPPKLRGQAVTLAGHASRATEGGLFSIEAEAQEIASWLDDADTVLIGHSMGTRIALEIAHIASHRVKALVLIDGSCVPGNPTLTARAIALQGKVALVAELLEDTMTARLDPAQMAELTNGMMQMPEAAMADYAGSMAAWDTNKAMERIKAVSVPVLVMQSTRFSNDRVPRRKEIKADAGSVWFDEWENMPNAIRRTFLETGHYLAQERPAATSMMLESFLSEI